MNKNKVAPPALHLSSVFVWGAFSELSTARHELGPIPWTAVNEYAKRYRLSNTEFDSFIFFIRALDNEYRRIKQEEMKKEMESKKSLKRR